MSARGILFPIRAIAILLSVVMVISDITLIERQCNLLNGVNFCKKATGILVMSALRADPVQQDQNPTSIEPYGETGRIDKRKIKASRNERVH